MGLLGYLQSNMWHGISIRSRDCNNPIPLNGGTYCSGSSYQTQECRTKHCQVDGKWGSWSEWGQCNVICGGGKQRRTRSCTSPAPAYGGSFCIGTTAELQSCSKNGCPVPGSWGIWASWESCSRSCGGGYTIRRQYCDSPSPSNGGCYCSGNSVDKQICNNKNCPVNGNWGLWSIWGSCNATCGSAIESRYRRCDNPAPYYGGNTFIGPSSQVIECNDTVCLSRYNCIDLEHTQHSRVVIGGVAGGSIVGTLLMLLGLYGIYVCIKNTKQDEQETPSHGLDEMREDRDGRNDEGGTVELLCSRIRSGNSEGVTRGRRNDYRETIELPFNSAMIGINDSVARVENDYREMSEKPRCNASNDVNDLMFMENETKNAEIYDNLKL